ncbi:MAG TPA: hypothetical protein VMC79_15645 [Rectinemataceae bacterium]|nr:hypothetical protein [Rectinemataceae bacterium]
MLIPLYATLAVAVLFYLVIPLSGAVSVAHRWRRFRKRVAEVGRLPPLSYRDTTGAAGNEASPAGGSFRLLGRIEAMEGEKRIWVQGEQSSALVDLSSAPLHVLSPGAAEPGSVRRVAWRSISSLAAGTRIMVGGRLRIENGKPTFVDLPEERLIAVTFDGEPDDLVRRLIIGGRRLNEYWTAIGPLSLAAGMTISSGLLLVLGGHSTFSTVRALSFLAAIIPILPVLPPGLGLFLLYRVFWRRALRHRTRRDLLRLDGDGLETFSESERKAVGREQLKADVLMLLALGCCGSAVLLNYVAAFLAWRVTP